MRLMHRYLFVHQKVNSCCAYDLIRERKKRFEFIFFRQQQQLERVKKWLQLRNRDNDHRSQVEERRKKRDEEAKV
jgi:hypothetical protein